MSILIMGMAMPKRCGECPCFHAENPMYCQAVKADKNKKIIAPYGKPKPDWCPLIEVPSHGRLIDADAFEKANAYFWGRDFINPKYSDTLADLVNAAPTVIPAEEGEQ